MDSDPSTIPVQPIPFVHGLTRFAHSLTRGQAKIVAIGSSTTAGEGNIAAYPGRLLSFLQAQYPYSGLAMVNKGIGGQEAPIELQRFDADVILMDLQYVPAVLTPAKKDKAIAMVEAIGELARDAGVNVFRRFAFMKGLYRVEQVSFDRIVDPTDDSRLHDSDWTTGRVAWALKLAIVDGVDKARSNET